MTFTKNVTLVALTSAVASAGSVVDPELSRAIKSSQESSFNIVVKIKGGVDAAVKMTKEDYFTSRTQRISALKENLEEMATYGQESVMQLLEKESMSMEYGEAESFWISNSVYIADASPALIKKLSKLPAVGDIHEEHIIELDPLPGQEEMGFNTSDASVANMDWGIPKIGADAVWSTGNRGKNVIVGSVDTGVRGTHEALVGNYVGKERHGWYDPYSGSDSPNDGNGHGTHTMGTIVGANGVGVAPEAEWLSCMGCSAWGCTERALLACGQFILCPTDTEGNNADCSKAPHVSSNSWGGGQGLNWYADVVKAWETAGIVPVFANGNSGPSCKTANSPGDYSNVIGVGATTVEDEIAYFSSMGPSVTGLLKPDISAPGHNVRSAWHTGDNSYETISGTSMACPHVAGVVALMKSHQNSLTYQQIYTAITHSATTDNLKGLGKHCGSIQETEFPNNVFGYGQINAFNAIEYVKNGPVEPEDPVDDDDEEPTECYLDLESFSCQPEDSCRWSWAAFNCVDK